MQRITRQPASMFARFFKKVASGMLAMAVVGATASDLLAHWPSHRSHQVVCAPVSRHRQINPSPAYPPLCLPPVCPPRFYPSPICPPTFSYRTHYRNNYRCYTRWDHCFTPSFSFNYYSYYSSYCPPVYSAPICYTPPTYFYTPAVVVPSYFPPIRSVPALPTFQVNRVDTANDLLASRIAQTRSIVERLQGGRAAESSIDSLPRTYMTRSVPAPAYDAKVEANRAFAQGEYWIAVKEYRDAGKFESGKSIEERAALAMQLGIAQVACEMYDEAAKSFRWAHEHGATFNPSSLPGGSLKKMYGSYPGNEKVHLEQLAKAALQMNDNVPELWSVAVLLQLRGETERAEPFLAQVAAKPNAYSVAASSLLTPAAVERTAQNKSENNVEKSVPKVSALTSIK